jgi:hypothetical protein
MRLGVGFARSGVDALSARVPSRKRNTKLSCKAFEVAAQVGPVRLTRWVNLQDGALFEVTTDREASYIRTTRNPCAHTKFARSVVGRNFDSVEGKAQPSAERPSPASGPRSLGS